MLKHIHSGCSYGVTQPPRPPSLPPRTPPPSAPTPPSSTHTPPPRSSSHTPPPPPPHRYTQPLHENEYYICPLCYKYISKQLHRIIDHLNDMCLVQHVGTTVPIHLLQPQTVTLVTDSTTNEGRSSQSVFVLQSVETIPEQSCTNLDDFYVTDDSNDHESEDDLSSEPYDHPTERSTPTPSTRETTPHDPETVHTPTDDPTDHEHDAILDEFDDELRRAIEESERTAKEEEEKRKAEEAAKKAEEEEKTLREIAQSLHIPVEALRAQQQIALSHYERLFFFVSHLGLVFIKLYLSLLFNPFISSPCFSRFNPF